MLDDIEEIKRNVPLEEVLRYHQHEPVRITPKGILEYKSPFRPDENEPSFFVDPIKNVWHDFGRTARVDAHGSNIDFQIDFTGGDRKDKKAIADAIAFLKGFSYIAPRPFIEPEEKAYSDRYRIISVNPKITHPRLINHILWRGLDPRLIEHIKQVHYEDKESGNKFNGFCLENVKGGLDVSVPHPATNKTFKTSIGPKAPTIIEPIKSGGFKASAFEGMWDMETWKQTTPNWQEFYIIVLNGAGNAAMVRDYVPDMDFFYSFLDNDRPGIRAEEILCQDFRNVGSMRHTFEPFKDLSDMHRDKKNNKEAGASMRPTSAPRLKL